MRQAQVLRRRVNGVVAVFTVVAGLGLSACGQNGSTLANRVSGDRTVYRFWDSYPQRDDASPWGQLVQECGREAGVTLKRSRSSTLDAALLAARQGNAPDVLVLDNPEVSTLVEASALASTEQTHLDVSGVLPNVLAAGQRDGKTYGIPIGANTLALYYNKRILDAAGVDPASVKDWDSLNAALAKVKAIGKMGITFSAINSEEGSFQFLPWFWGAGAELSDLHSPAAVAALQLWVSWVQKGYAPESVVNANQMTSWKRFTAGDVAFAEDGTWELDMAKSSGLDWGVIPIPARAGGTAPAPLGGEFIAIPVQKDAGRYAVSARIVSCLTRGENALRTDQTLMYIAVTRALQDKQVSDREDLRVWGVAVRAAKGRTSHNLGTKYVKVSQLLWPVFTAVLTGSSQPGAALSAAQAVNPVR